MSPMKVQLLSVHVRIFRAPLLHVYPPLSDETNSTSAQILFPTDLS